MIQLHQAYAAVYDNDDIRLASSSGGVFTLIAEDVLAQGGVVCGAGFTEELQVAHQWVEQIKDLDNLRRSKYVRSQLGQTYAQAKTFLDTGRPVLFTGTPCQIGGLLQYLKQDYPNLICQDMICHGSPMPQVWEKYLRFREKQAGAKAVRVNFRDKHTGWSSFGLSITFDNGSVYRQDLRHDPYLQSFLRDLTLGSACYQCRFRGKTRPADITLADFWGAERLLPELYDNKGTSLVFVHTEKGQALLEKLLPQLKLMAVDTDQAIACNTAMLHSPARPQAREAFLEALTEENFAALTAKYCPQPSLLQRVRRKLGRILRKLHIRK